MRTGGLRIELILTGYYAGKTIRLNNLDFIEGHCFVDANPQSIAYAVAYYASYGAFPKGSPELEFAQKRDAELKNGKHNPQETSQRGNSDAISGSLQRNGEGASIEAVFERPGHVDYEAGSTGSSATGSGLKHTGLSDGAPTSSNQSRELANSSQSRGLSVAVKKLDPDNNDHWTETGFPKLSAVEEVYGSPGITRQDIVNAIDWNRDMAREAAIKAL